MMLNKTFSKTQNTAQNAKNISLAKRNREKKPKNFPFQNWRTEIVQMANIFYLNF